MRTSPLPVDLRAVGLDRVRRPLPGPQIPIRELDRAAKKSTPVSVGSPPCQAIEAAGNVIRLNPRRK